MRFFFHQQQARRRSWRLVGWYVLAFCITVSLSSAGIGSLLVLLGGTQHGILWHYLLPALFIGSLTIGLSLHRLQELKRGGAAVAERLGGEALHLQNATFAERRLLNVAAETAVAAGLPTPPVYLLRRDGSINAFAAGIEQQQAVIGITQGALALLNRDELQAVIAHEFSHIRNGDMRLNLYLSVWLHGLQGISSSGRYLVYGRDDEHYLEYRRRKNVDTHPFDNSVEILMQALPLQAFGMLLLCLGSAGSLLAGWIQAAVCRQREFLADASAVQLTRQTAPLVEALRKTAYTDGCRLHSSHAPEYAHMMFGSITHRQLAATHPPLLERIRRLDAVAARRLADELADADGLTLFPSDTVGFVPPSDNAPVIEQTEAIYRHRQASMQARIQRYRPSAPNLPLQADWQAAAWDGEYAAAALFCLFQIPGLPENKLPHRPNNRDDNISPFVWQQLARLQRHPMLPSAEMLEHLLPALVMQEDAAQQALLNQIRNHFRRCPATTDQTYLWLLLKAYLAPVPLHGHLSRHPAAEALLRASALSSKQLQPAVKAALLLTEPAKVALLRPLSAALPASHPLLWRYLCVRLDMAAWHFGTTDRGGC